MTRQVHGIPQCPYCGHGSSRVVNTAREVKGEYDTVRYRECRKCSMRFYTGQVNEELLDWVRWDGWAISETKRLAS